MKLSEDIRMFILNWGEKLSHWGLNRTEAQIYTLLFLSPNPLTMEEIVETLNVSRSNVTNSLTELQNWKIVKLVNVIGDRRKHFECLKNTWQIFRAVVHEQKRREIDPMVELLKETREKINDRPSEDYVKEKMDEMLAFFNTTLGWYDRLDQMPAETLSKYMKLANSVDKFLKQIKFQ